MLLPALVASVPQGYGGSYGGGHCTTHYDTIYTKECKTSYGKQCHQNQKVKYRTEYDEKCDTSYETNCYPVPRDVPEQECKTDYEEVCTKETRQTYETKYDQKLSLIHI